MSPVEGDRVQASLLTGLQAIGLFMVAPLLIVQGCGDDIGEGARLGEVFQMRAGGERQGADICAFDHFFRVAQSGGKRRCSCRRFCTS